MATETDGGEAEAYCFRSYIRGYHQYKEIWEPTIGEILLLKTEEENTHDRFAVAVQREGVVVGHIPFNLAPVASYFLEVEGNKGEVEVTGARVNRGAGYGLEIPCMYRFFGGKNYVKRLKTVLEKYM